MQPHGVGLVWTGRWGRWGETAVRVLAACVGDVELLMKANLCSATAQRAVKALVSALHKEFVDGETCVHVLWTGPVVDRRCRVRLILACDSSSCKTMQRVWQCRPLLDGGVSASWLSSFDTASTAHFVRVKTKLKQFSPQACCVELDVPRRWVRRPPEPADDTQRTALERGNHWFDFASLFGNVCRADLFFSKAFNTAKLVVQFASCEGSHAMFEALTERCLYNPRNRNVDDTHPVVCCVSHIEAVNKKFLHVPHTKVMGYALVRSGKSHDCGICPRSITIRWPEIHLTIGRDPVCDVLVQRKHVSKTHARLDLRQDAETECWQLYVTDSSANGTWVNEVRLSSGRAVRLRLGDRISFLPSAHQYYTDNLVYVMAEELFDVPHSEMKRETAETRPQKRLAVREEALPNTRQRLTRQESTTSTTATPQASPTLFPADPVASDEISTWLRTLGATFPETDLRRYDETLHELFESVSQIGYLYSDVLQDFFEDVHVQDPDHRSAFAEALRALKNGATHADP